MIVDGASRDLNIIERDSVIRELLIILVSLARDQHNVARLCERNGATDGLGAIDNFLIPSRAKPFFDLGDDRARILFARIIGSNDRIVGMTVCYFSHQRALLAVTIAAAAKNDNQAMWLEFPKSLENISKRVGSVRIINENLILSFCRNQFQASRHLRRLAETEHRLAQTDSQSVGRRQRCDRVCYVKPSDQRETNQIAFAASGQLIGSAAKLNAII